MDCVLSLIHGLCPTSDNFLSCIYQDVEKELQLQISMKQEIEMALQLLEKDIHEKQDSIIGLRKQLEDVKNINLQMYEKLEVRIKSFITVA